MIRQYRKFKVKTIFFSFFAHKKGNGLKMYFGSDWNGMYEGINLYVVQIVPNNQHFYRDHSLPVT